VLPSAGANVIYPISHEGGSYLWEEELMEAQRQGVEGGTKKEVRTQASFARQVAQGKVIAR
jgi:hypothetical protein